MKTVEVEVTVSTAQLAQDVFNDQFKAVGELTATNSFKFKKTDDGTLAWEHADEFAETVTGHGVEVLDFTEGWEDAEEVDFSTWGHRNV